MTHTNYLILLIKKTGEVLVYYQVHSKHPSIRKTNFGVTLTDFVQLQPLFK